MTTAYTSLLGLALPVTGELSGTWGDVVNNEITSLVDSAVAGTTTLSTDADVTLTTTTGTANQARQMVLLCTGARTALRTITAPAQSKSYVIINATSGGFDVKIVGVGPTTGVTVPAGTRALVSWNTSDFVKVSSSLISLTADVTGTLPVLNGGTGQTTYTDGQLLIGNTTGNTLTKATLTAGSGVSITNGSGAITINATGLGGTVTSASVVSANGFAGTVATATTTPAITLSTSITGVLKGDGTAISAATAGTDYLIPPSGTSLLKANSGGALANATAGTDYVAPGTATTFTAAQSFAASGILLKGSSTGYTTFASANTSATAYTVTFPAETMTVGYLNIPQNSQSAAYTLVLSDSGKQIFHPSADTTARTFTIPANSSVAFSIGTAVTFINQNGAGVVTIAITTDTMRFAGTGTTGSRTLAANGIATAVKVTATEWIISGTNLT